MQTTVLKAFALLEHLARSEGSCGVSELARALGLQKSNVHRLLSTLVSLGYVTRLAGGRYKVTLRLWEIGVQAHRDLEVTQVARSYLRELVTRTTETVHLGIIDGTEVIHIDKIEGTNPVRSYTRVGGRAPAHCAATGKAILSYLPESAVSIFSPKLKRFTERTIATRDDLVKDLRNARAKGYAVNRGEWHESVCGLAAPIIDHQGEVVAAIGISGPIQRLTAARLAQYAPDVVEMAQSISRGLGYRQDVPLKQGRAVR